MCTRTATAWCQKQSFLRKVASADWLGPFSVLYADCCVDVVLADVDLPWIATLPGADVALCATGLSGDARGSET
jgi:hypothetical protein